MNFDAVNLMYCVSVGITTVLVTGIAVDILKDMACDYMRGSL